MSAKQKHPLATLPFIGRRKKGEPGKFPRHFWRVEPTGDYFADCEMGRRFGLEYLAFCEAHQNEVGPTLGHIVGDMPRELTGVEVAFMEMIYFAAVTGAHEARRVDAYWKKCAKTMEIDSTRMTGGRANG